MFGLGGTPSLPSAGEVLVFLLLVGLVAAVVLRGPLFASRETVEADRARAFKIGVAMVVGWIAFLVVVFAVAVVKLWPTLADWYEPPAATPGSQTGAAMPILDAVVTGLVPLAVFAGLVALLVGARRRRGPAAEPEASVPPGVRVKLGLLKVIAGIMVFGWIVQYTVLAYWRWRMPE
jgi:hypothetical protein